MALNEARPDVKTKWAVLKVDDTQHWFQGLKFEKQRRLVKRVISRYLVDLHTVTYCCSLTPSYYLLMLTSEWEGRADRADMDGTMVDWVDHEIMDGDALSEPPGTYMNCRGVDPVPRIEHGELPPEGGMALVVLTDLEGADEDDALDYVNANCV